MKSYLNQIPGSSLDKDEPQSAPSQSTSFEDFALDSKGQRPTTEFPRIAPTAPGYAEVRDATIKKFFAELEKHFVPKRRPLTAFEKKVLKTPIGIAPK